VESLADIRPTVAEIDRIVAKASEMLPVLETTRFTRAYAGVRPLIDTHAGGDDRSAGRGFALLDHSREGLENFATISGGKLTTYRLMAEKAADLVCKRLGASGLCQTRSKPLPASPAGKWTVPGLASRLWLAGHPPGDAILCACELVPKSTVEQVIDSLEAQRVDTTLRAVGIRSRMGKGPCQGAFCGLRTTSFMYDRGRLRSDQGLAMLTEFFRERWKGQRPVLWNGQLIQVELTEAIHCGLLNLESGDPPGGEKPR
jgi:glycerol-3-phosphate dehydrogenase